MLTEIKSADNKFVKLAKSLKQRKYRDEEKIFVIEGLKSCLEVPKEKIKYIFISEDFYEKSDKKFINNPEDQQITTFKIPGKIFQDISSEETPEGILFIVKKPDYKIEDCIKEKNQFILILDRIQDPGNLGTIIRTAAAFELSAVILLKGTVDLYNPKVTRASSGFLFNIPVIENASVQEIFPVLSKLNFAVISADSKHGKDMPGVKLNYPMALVIGNEGNGIDEEILELTTHVIKIPISDKVDSLNASVSAGILIYELKRLSAESR